MNVDANCALNSMPKSRMWGRTERRVNWAAKIECSSWEGITWVRDWSMVMLALEGLNNTTR